MDLNKTANNKKTERQAKGYEKENKAFVGLGGCDNVQTERKIFEYANWPNKIKRTGLSSWSVQLVQLIDPFTHCILHIPSYTIHLAHCF